MSDLERRIEEAPPIETKGEALAALDRIWAKAAEIEPRKVHIQYEPKNLGQTMRRVRESLRRLEG